MKNRLTATLGSLHNSLIKAIRLRSITVESIDDRCG